MVVFNGKRVNQNLSKEIMNQVLEFIYCVHSPRFWDWGRIPFELPFKVKSIIQAIPIPITSRGQDRLAWSCNLRGVFDLKSAYSLAMAEEVAPPFSSN